MLQHNTFQNLTDSWWGRVDNLYILFAARIHIFTEHFIVILKIRQSKPVQIKV